ncbi:type III PLP-dependent enzyme [Actinophytocola sp.]|uniref:type III PLP-dependent enzyme n=1 Tax=Actinophytocola sp. TaxID=1872138 RepID=UPI002ED63E55
MTDLLLSVVDEVGSPVYVYDLAEVRTNQRRLRAALPHGAGVYYALSANPHPELLREIRAGGALPAVRSPGELDMALVAGWSAEEILYTGPARRSADLDWALWLGVRNFTVDSPAGLVQLAERATVHQREVDCLLRVNAGALPSTGADPEQVLAEPADFAGRAGARVNGLHVCVTEESHVDDAAALAGRLASALARHGVRAGKVNLSGCPAPRFAGLVHGRSGAFEVGPDLVGSAGLLLTAVLDVRRTGSRQLVVLESGAGHVGGFDGPRRRGLVPRLVSRSPSGELVETVLTGPQETPVDVWTTPVRLPPLREGDLMAVPGLGAWGPTAGLVGFASPAVPVEVVVDRDDPDPGIVHVSRLSVTRYPEDGGV